MNAQEKLQEALIKGVNKIEELFNPLILSAEVYLGMLEEANVDPSKYFSLQENRFVNYYKRRDELIKQRDLAIRKLEVEVALQKEKISQAEASAQTPEGEPSSSWEEIAILIIKEVVKNGVKIKVGDVEWDSEKPLGGEGSIFDELRDGTFKLMGIDPNSELASILKDPFNKLGGAIDNVNNEIGSKLTDIKKVTDKALLDAKKEADKTLTDIKKATDKALTDVARETSKALDDVRKTADKALKDIGRELGSVVRKLPKIGGGFKW